MPVELFTNNATTTVSSGGTTAPAAGTVETWTVASSATFPAASNTAHPAAQFTVVDAAAASQGELIRVENVSGTTWTVMRGVEGTTPIAHSAGFTVAHIVTAGSLTATVTSNFQSEKMVALRRFSAAMADVANNPCDILCIGDSITEGSNATDPNQRWIALVRDQLRSTNAVVGVGGGPNYIPVVYDAPTLTDVPVITGTPTRAGAGLGTRSYILNTATPTITYTVFGTSAKVFFLRVQPATQASYALDGAAAVNFSVGGSTSPTFFDDLSSQTITFATRGTHTIVLKWVSGGDFYAEGLAIYDGDEAKGVRLWDGGIYGADTGIVMNNISNGTWHFGDYITRIQPHLVILQLGTNDANAITGNIPSATYKTNNVAIIAAIKAACTVPPSIVLLGMYQPDATFLEPWGRYIQALYEIAHADPACTVLDLTSRFPPVLGDVNGLYADGAHPSQKGQVSIGSQVANFLTDDEKVAYTAKRVNSRLTAAATSTVVAYAQSGLGVWLAANTTYTFRAYGQYRAAATTTGLGLRMNGTATVTRIRHRITIWNASTPTTVTASALTTANLTAAVTAANTDYAWEIEGVIAVGATAGDLRVEFATEVAASTVTIQADAALFADPA